MGFLFWLFCSILVVALVLLLFPFSVLIEFEAGERGARALFFFFKKKVYEYEKKWGKGLDERLETRDERTEVVGSRKSEVGSDEGGPEQSFSTEGRESIHSKSKDPESRESLPQSSSKPVILDRREGNHNFSFNSCEGDPVQSNAGSENAPATKSEVEERDERQETPTTEAVAKKPEEPPKTEKMKAPAGESCDASHETPAEDSKPKKEKRKLSDREFWTIILTPDFDVRAFRYVKKILVAVLSLFRVKFIDCFVEGIQSDYMSMGYGAAINGFLKSFPYIGAWDFRMDWCHEKELRAAGGVRMSVNLLRILCFVLETLVLVGILAISFWRRRSRVIKTNELPELGFIRRKIVDFIVEE
jgi:hypothetical protein